VRSPWGVDQGGVIIDADEVMVICPIIAVQGSMFRGDGREAGLQRRARMLRRWCSAEGQAIPPEILEYDLIAIVLAGPGEEE